MNGDYEKRALINTNILTWDNTQIKGIFKKYYQKKIMKKHPY